MTTKYTKQDALAFIAISGTTRGLTVNTRIAVTDGYDYDLKLGKHVVNDQGRHAANRSRIMKAHLFCLSLGFRVNRQRTCKKSFICYIHTDDTIRTTAFHCAGRVYVGRSTTEMVAEFKNG